MALKINDEEVDDIALEEEFESIKEYYERLGEVVCCDRDQEFQRYAIDNLTNRTVLAQESVKRFGEPSAEEMQSAREELIQQHGSEDEMWSNLNMSPTEPERLEAKIRQTLLVNKVLADHLGEEKQPSREELEAFYQENLADYMTETEIRPWHIYVEPTSHEESAELYQKLCEARKELKEGADFEEKVKELCTADEYQMDLGPFRKEGRMPEIETVVFSLEVGEISPVIASHFGMHIFKVMERKEPEPIPFGSLKPEIEERFVREDREKRIDAFISGLKSNSSISGEFQGTAA